MEEPRARKYPKSPPPKKEPYYTPAQVAEALILNHGNATAAARVLDCHPETVRNYCERHPEVQAARESGIRIRLDKAEAALDAAVEQREGWAVCFTLKTIGKVRGYTERHEITGAEGEPLAVMIYMPDNARG